MADPTDPAPADAPRRRRPWLALAVVLGGAVSGAHGWFIVHAHQQALMPGGSTAALGALPLLGTLSVAVLLATPLLLVLLLPPATRRLAGFALIVSLLNFAGIVVGSRVAWERRLGLLERVAGAGDPLADAVRAYAAEHGAPPDALDALTPGLLAAIPDPGLPTGAAFRYEVTPDPGAGGALPDPAWALRVALPSIGSPEFLVYRPGEVYPQQEPGASLTPVGRWALRVTTPEPGNESAGEGGGGL